jgi:plastocyanin
MTGWRRTSALAVLGVCIVAACKKGDQAANTPPGAAPAPAAAPTEFPVPGDQQATVNGRVAFTGTKPAPQRIDMSEEATCAAKHTGGAFGETVVVNDNGTLRNVFVYVKSGLDANLRFPVPSDAVELNQEGCQYKPHVLGVQVGQTINIKNSDGVLHNIKATPTVNRPFNISQPTNMTTPRNFTAPETMVPLQCNVHSWMNGFAGVLAHPYFSVTGADGTFSLKRLPPGTYVIEAWQEHYPAQTQTVTVGAHETKDVVFTFHG